MGIELERILMLLKIKSMEWIKRNLLKYLGIE
jgi:hypothetical protein